MGALANPFELVADLVDPPDLEGVELEEHQIPPEGDWGLWLLEGGRGAGKSYALSSYLAKYMRSHPGARARIIAPTYPDAVESLVNGPAGVLNIDPTAKFHPATPGGSVLRWPNAAEALLLGTPTPRDVERLRASGNRELDVWEEMAANPQLGPAWDMAKFGLRIGSRPHSIAATTPRLSVAYKRIRKLRRTMLVHATMGDNPHNPKDFIEEMEELYGGTRLGRTELRGELIEEAEGALWRWENIERNRIRAADLPALHRIVVGVDPAASSGESANDTGIIIAGIAKQGRLDHAYVLADRSLNAPPHKWAKAALDSLRDFRGDRIVPERNNGGEMVEETIRAIEPSAPVKSVWASRGKHIRAEPVATLYEQGRVHHVEPLPELETEQTTWEPGDKESPNRLDALVWAITDLMPMKGTKRVRRVQISAAR